ncbi:hypothetical protein [Halobacillus mangrovi]|uniref:Uncharacterized protein n=1 Tax=Halobacillus mangrovi TaxID=402384 RepID=A0A1W5ZZX2_9BACI|nr:hypothetical protein [Halobacillus mangrovi]ARI78804.1 hypothetical protein HM131_19045 [Halobacillus mangrovi]
MTNKGKQLSNAYSTGGGGANFENRVQASFVVLMLTGGFSPCLPNWPIAEIKLQGKYQGFDTDDVIVFAKQPGSDRQAKLLGQIKHSISITESNKAFGEVIQATWKDFNNKHLFNDSTDALALITGPLSAKDTINVRGLLNQAHYSKNAADFIERISYARFTGEGQREKLGVFRTHLKHANNDVEVSDEELWRFLKSFNLLLYDLDIKGVTLSLLHTLIGQYSQKRSEDLLALIEKEVSHRNENASYINIDSIPEDIRSAFKEREKRTIPSEFIEVQKDSLDSDWNTFKYADDLVKSSLLGSWNEKYDGDTDIVSHFADKEYSQWISHVREILQYPESPVTLKDGIWSVLKRKELVSMLDHRVYDDILERFKNSAITILVERDPKFSLPSSQRFAASFYQTEVKCSPSLRKGIAEGLALLGSYDKEMPSCSENPKVIVDQIVQELFKDSDWELWGSLDYLLPLIAEASPEQFLIAVEKYLQQEPCPFDKLFKQESDVFGGENYLTGLLWALETLAWDDRFLVRVTVILGDLAFRDPGGTWSNRPSKSLTTIFLPWFPQTKATIEKRKVAVQTLLKEVPLVGWKLLINLIPNKFQTSTGSHKPKWRMDILKDETIRVTGKDYWDQVSGYCELAVNMAENNLDKLTELVNYLNHLPRNSIERMLHIISSQSIISKPEKERMQLWTELVKFSSKHRRFSEFEWSLNSEMVTKIESVAKALAPKNPMNLHQILFRNDTIDIFVSEGNWEDQSKEIEQRRQTALREIFNYGGIDGIIKFSNEVDHPESVGFLLGLMTELKIDEKILPNLLKEENKLLQFTKSFIKGRFQSGQWEWVDSISKTDWDEKHIGEFFACLPFYKKTWERAIELLGDRENEFWEKVKAIPSTVDSDLNEAIDKLLYYDRPNEAVNCLYTLYEKKHLFNNDRVAKALLEVVNSNATPTSMDTYHYVELIRKLQNDPNTNSEDLFNVEWAFLPLLDDYSNTSPKFLENKLASDPRFFNEVIGIVYRSKKEKDPEDKPTEEQQTLASNAYKLLSNWKTPPGLKEDGTFSEDDFNDWLKVTKEMCKKTGHIDVALSHVGRVLFYSAPDDNGLWINEEVASALNSRDGEMIRNGFRMEVINSRGPVTVDPSGKPEKDLAVKYRSLADKIENAGYYRFATTLKSIADSYEYDAEQIIKMNLEIKS